MGLFLVPTVYAIFGFTRFNCSVRSRTLQLHGLAEFPRMIHDPVFWSSVKLTLIFVIGSGIIAQTVLGMALALLGQRAYIYVRVGVGAIVILAWVLPEIAVAFIWYAFSQAVDT